MKKCTFLFIFMSLIFASHASFAKKKPEQVKIQSLRVLTKMATQFLQEELEGKVAGRVVVTPGFLDHRLRLPYCPIQSLHTFLPDHIPNITKTNVVGIKCNEGDRWSLFIPVDIDIYAKIPVAVRPISRGEILSHNDLKIIEFNLEAINQGYFQDSDSIVGKAARRNIYANKPILNNDLTVPKVVKRGDSLTISASKGRLNVTMHGVALGGGSVGQTISVKNTSSNKVIQATIVGPKYVKVVI